MSRAWLGRSRRLLSELRDWVRHLCLAGLFFYFFTTFAFQTFEVEGVSMLPLLQDHERIFVNRYVYRLQPVERGEVVVFWYPPAPSRTLVKRVIGVPGDRVSLREGRVFLNRQAVAEPYLPEAYRSEDNLPSVVVPPGYYFVLGDHRRSSDDSRRWGLVPERYILGKVVLRFWPFEQFGLVPHARLEPAPGTEAGATARSAAATPATPAP